METVNPKPIPGLLPYSFPTCGPLVKHKPAWMSFFCNDSARIPRTPQAFNINSPRWSVATTGGGGKEEKRKMPHPPGVAGGY